MIIRQMNDYSLRTQNDTQKLMDLIQNLFLPSDSQICESIDHLLLPKIINEGDLERKCKMENSKKIRANQLMQPSFIRIFLV